MYIAENTKMSCVISIEGDISLTGRVSDFGIYPLFRLICQFDYHHIGLVTYEDNHVWGGR